MLRPRGPDRLGRHVSCACGTVLDAAARYGRSMSRQRSRVSWYLGTAPTSRRGSLALAWCTVLALGVSLALAQDPLPPGTDGGVLPSAEAVDERYLTLLAEIAASPSGRAFLDALLLIDREYLYPTDRDALLRGATAGLIAALDDPYSRYLDPAEVEARRSNTRVDAAVRSVALGDVGYLALPSFEGDDVGGSLARAVDALILQGARGLVLDLRGNAGGSILQGLQVLDRFIADGVLGFRRVRGVSVPIAYANPRSVAQPLVVLVDGRTASTAEIVAGALQAYERALLVGSVTAGKGIGQSAIELSDGAEVQLVSFEWLLPGFRSIDGSGLRPDVEVPVAADPDGGPAGITGLQDVDGDPVLRAALQTLRSVIGDDLSPPSPVPSRPPAAPPAMLPLQAPDAEPDPDPDPAPEPEPAPDDAPQARPNGATDEEPGGDPGSDPAGGQQADPLVSLPTLLMGA